MTRIFTLILIFLFILAPSLTMENLKTVQIMKRPKPVRTGGTFVNVNPKKSTVKYFEDLLQQTEFGKKQENLINFFDYRRRGVYSTSRVTRWLTFLMIYRFTENDYECIRITNTDSDKFYVDLHKYGNNLEEMKNKICV